MKVSPLTLSPAAGTHYAALTVALSRRRLKGR